MTRFLLCLFLVACGKDVTAVALAPLSAPEIVETCERAARMPSTLSVGVAHANGTYPKIAAGESFLNAGASEVEGLGAKTIKLFLTPDYAMRYPETWPTGIHDLKSLADSANYRKVFAQPFDTYSLLTYSFALGVGDPWRDHPSAALLAAETAEIQALAEHLLTTYAGTGKTFILHNWESDWPLRAGDVVDEATLKLRAERMIAWINARQAGVAAARKKIHADGVQVLHSIEVNKVIDTAVTVRAATHVLPHVCTDLVSYSAYEATNVSPALTQAAAEAQVTDDLTRGLRTLRTLAAPGTELYVSEFGFPENDFIGSKIDVAKLVERVLMAAEREHVSHAVYWQIFDNECTGAGTGCRGFWTVRPDGSVSKAGEGLQRFMRAR
ncbi:MAG: hypothetical protein IT381_13115 [Deltaproteobacteria bacterium]|nr:hypothetical protein [Deltaproteobacteria bacterium]